MNINKGRYTLTELKVGPGSGKNSGFSYVYIDANNDGVLRGPHNAGSTVTEDFVLQRFDNIYLPATISDITQELLKDELIPIGINEKFCIGRHVKDSTGDNTTTETLEIRPSEKGSYIYEEKNDSSRLGRLVFQENLDGFYLAVP